MSNQFLETFFNNHQQLLQRQDSTIDQLKDLRQVANRLGLYDAADFLKSFTEGR